ncbi:MAG TPA: MFS transporter, partial [Planctomycetota bacterium]|nr:MFS transporter [Planctomycetota bacterium]
HRGGPVRELLGNLRFVLFLAAAGLILGSHGAYYSLSTNDWHRHGIDELTAGLLWAEGIIAEVAFFWFARRRLAHLRPTTLILVGGCSAVLRWLGLGATHDVGLLAALNWLHAVSFACTFLGAVQYVHKRVPDHQRATGQGLLGAISSGVCTALATMLAAFVYRDAGGHAYLAMAALAAAGTLLTLVVRRMPYSL